MTLQGDLEMCKSLFFAQRNDACHEEGGQGVCWSGTIFSGKKKEVKGVIPEAIQAMLHLFSSVFQMSPGLPPLG